MGLAVALVEGGIRRDDRRLDILDYLFPDAPGRTAIIG
jgi:hypothetical protein